MPLRSLSGPNRGAFQILDKSKSRIPVSAVSAVSQTALHTVNGDGLIGATVGGTIALSAQNDGKGVAKHLQQETNGPENRIFGEVIKEQLQKSGLGWTDQKNTRTLELELKSVILREMQRGYWQIIIFVKADVINSQRETMWSASIYGTSDTLRHVDDYTRQPESYTEDIHSAAEDAARQLVNGPIRK